jgi:uncharacterized protein YegJ (DUF2314 family)
MWVSVTGINGRQVSGTLVDQPDDDIGLKERDLVTLSPDQIEDWNYEENGSLVGNFSGPVLDAIEAEQKK